MSRYLIDIDYIALPLHCVPGFARWRAVVLGGGSCPRITRVARSMRKQEGAPHHVWAATTAESGMADVDQSRACVTAVLSIDDVQAVSSVRSPDCGGSPADA